MGKALTAYMPRFTPNFDLGHVLTILCLLAAMFMGYGRLTADLRNNGDALLEVRKELKDVNAVLVRFREEQVRNSSWIDTHKNQDRVLSPSDCLATPTK